MIKTVFYFTETEQQYLSLWRNGEVSPNTIVLCKDTHSLWKGGERYGVGSTPEGDDYIPYDDTELVERINDIVEQLEDLAEQIGQGEKGMTDEEKEQMENLAEQLVAVSNGLDTANEVAASEKQRLNGLLDGIQASIDSMTAQAEADEASIQQLAADIQSLAASIQEHSEWIQNREEEDSTSWKSGWNANIEAYLQEVGIWARDNGITETQFTQLSQSVDTISSSVNNLQEDMQTKATKTEFSTITQRADAIETRVASVETGLEGKATTTQFSQLSQTVDGINTRVSSVEEDVEGKVGASEFSTLSQRVNSIDLAVQALTPSEDGSISDQMQATIEQAVRDGVAELNLSATYAKKSTETDLEATQDELENAEKVLEWMYSGLKISTDPEKTFNELVSAGKEGLANAVADLRTYVQKLKNGDYVASTAITSAVNNAIAALYSEAGNNNAKSLIFSKIASNTNSIDGLESDMDTAQDAIEQLQDDLSDGLNNINQNTQDIAAIVTSATGDNTSATIATKFANWKAGLATTSYVDGATAGLVSSDVLDQRVASFISQSDLDSATATMASKTEVEGLGTRLSSVETKANANEASITNLTTTGGRIAQVEQKASDTEAAISGLVDASTDTVTASKIWESLANDNSVVSAMRSEFATTVDGDGIATIVKEDIAQDVNNSSWDTWVAYMKGDVATAVTNYQTATANKAQWDAVVAYVDGKKTDIESIDDLSDSVSGLSTSLAGLSTSVGTLENEVTGIKSNYAQTSMFAQIKDNQGNVTAASIAAAVNGTTGSSKVTIDADHIDVSGVLTVANNAASAASAAQSTADSALAATTTIDGGNITTGTINSDRLNVSTIVGKINSSTGQNKLTINADHIDVSGVLTVANNAATAASNAASAASAAQTAADNAQNTANSAASAASTAQSTADGSIKAVWRIYYASSTNSAPAVPTAFITDETGGYNKWTTVRPAYSQSYKYLYTATQSKTNGNTVSTTTPVLDETTTVIDGGNIITGTVTANQLASDSVTAAKIAAGAVGANEIAANAITSAKIAAEAITADKVNLSSIVGAINDTTGTSKLVIDADHIDVSGVLTVANNAASAASAAQSTADSKLNSSAFTSDNIISKINGNTNTTTIDGGKITTGSITATQIDATDLVAVKLAATSGTVGGWTIGENQLNSGSGTSYVALNSAASNTNAYAMWAGNSTAASAPFSVTKAGALKATNADISGAITASSITLTGTATIPAAKISGTITAGTLAASKSFTSGGIALTGHTEITGDGFVNYVTRDGVSGKSNMNAINLDGSGYLANNKISWDASGNFQLGNNAIQYNASNSRLSISAYNVAMLSLLIQDLETTGGLIVGSDTTIRGELSVQGIVTSGIECSDAIIADGNISADGSITANDDIVANNCSIKVKNSSNDEVVVISSDGNITASTFQGATTTTVAGISIQRQVYISPTSFTLSSKRGASAAMNIVAFNEDGTGRVASGNINWTSAGALNITGSFTADSGEFSDTVSCVGIYSSDGGEISGTLSIKDGGNLYLYDSNDDATITMSSEDGEIYANSGIYVHYNSGSVTDTNGIDTSGLSLTHRTTGTNTVERTLQLDNSEGGGIMLRAYSKTGTTYTSNWPLTTGVADYTAVPIGEVVSLTLEDLKSVLNGSDSTKRGKWAVMMTRQYA